MQQYMSISSTTGHRQTHAQSLSRGSDSQPPQRADSAALRLAIPGAACYSGRPEQEPVVTIAASFEIEYRQYLDPDGNPIGSALPPIARDLEQLVAIYQLMSFTRVFDSKAIALQRTGKLGTYASSLGHEAAHAAIGSAMRPEDVLAPAYREYAAQFWRGVKPREVLLYWGGDERGNDFAGPRHDFAWSVPIATQCLHAAGSALAFKIRGEKRVAVSVCGDGGTSKADFYSALNSAGALELPMVLVVVNNQWAISVPRSRQSAAKTLAQKGIAGGLHCVQVDGNDLIACRAAMDEALTRARDGGLGSVIEMVTYRLHDHTTADDARRYRPDDEVKAAWQREPLGRLRAYLTRLGAWSDEKEALWLAECETRVGEEVDAYLNTRSQPVEAMFDYLYAEAPLDIAQQRALAVSREVGHG